MSAIEELLLTEIRKKNNDYKKDLERFYKDLTVYLNNLKSIDKDSDDEEMEVDLQNEENLFADCKDRSKLKDVSVSVDLATDRSDSCYFRNY